MRRNSHRALTLLLLSILGGGCAPHADWRGGHLLGGHYRDFDVDARALEVSLWGPLDHRPELGQTFFLARGDRRDGTSAELEIWHLDDAHRRVSVFRTDRRGTVLEAWRLFFITQSRAGSLLYIEEGHPWSGVRPERPPEPRGTHRTRLAFADGEWVEDGQIGEPLPAETAFEAWPGTTRVAGSLRVTLGQSPGLPRVLKIERLHPDETVASTKLLAFPFLAADEILDFLRRISPPKDFDPHPDRNTPPIWWEDGPNSG